jgi:hypothetical protein
MYTLEAERASVPCGGLMLSRPQGRLPPLPFPAVEQRSYL